MQSLFVAVALYAVMKGSNKFFCLHKVRSVADNIEIAMRSTDAEMMKKHLREAKNGINLFGKKKRGYPGVIHRKHYDLDILHEKIEEAIRGLEEDPEDLSQIKTKMSFSTEEVEEIIRKNHYWNKSSEGFVLEVSAQGVLIAFVTMTLNAILVGSKN